MELLESPHKRTSLVITGENLTSGRRLAEDAHRWLEKNQDGFYKLLHFVQGQQLKGIKGRLRDRVAVYCIENGIQAGVTGYKFANGLWAALARYMVLVDPSLLNNPIEMKDSVIDCYGLLPVSYLMPKELYEANE